jgi:hypothetical protein
MTARERRLASLMYKKPDKVTFEPGGARESTRRVWHQQGLPEAANYRTHLLEILDIEPDPGGPANLDVSFKMIPQFNERILEHKDGHYIVQDWMGAITEISDEYDYTYIRSAKDFVTRKWHKFPVETREDWEHMTARYNPHGKGRHPDDLDALCAELVDREGYLNIHFNGPFWQLREWVGFENLCMMMLDDPGWVEEMIQFWTDFVSDTLAPVLERITPDQVGMSEDMAYKHASMISPDMVRRFLVPAYERWVPQIRESGCEVVFMDSDGKIDELIPIWIESGINCCGPVEVASENDIVAFRETYGDQMAFTGGIDKRAIAKGGAVMETEVMRVVPPLLEQGGVIPGCDHGVPPDISWPDYVAYSRLLAELTGWL